MDALQTLLKQLKKAQSNPSLATDLQVWLDKGGLESLKPSLAEYLRGLEASTLEVMYNGVSSSYTIASSNTVTDIKQVISMREGVDQDRLIVQFPSGAVMEDATLLRDVGDNRVVVSILPTLRFQTGGVRTVLYDVPITSTTTIAQVKEYLATLSRVPVDEQKLIIGKTEPVDDAKIYTVWLAAGQPAASWFVKKERVYTLIGPSGPITIRNTYDGIVQDVIISLGPKLGMSSARILLEGSQGPLSRTTTMAEASAQGPIRIVILPTTPRTAAVPIRQGYHKLDAKMPMGSLVWVPIVSEGGITSNITVEPDTQLIQIKNIVTKNTGIPVTSQVYTMGEGDDEVILQDDWAILPTWVDAGRPTIVVSTAT